MSQITLKPLLVKEAGTARRVVFAGASPRMILGGLAENMAALELFEVKGQKASPLTTIKLLLPTTEFDVTATDPGEELIIAYGYHGGATSHLRIQPLGAKEWLQLPPRKTFAHETHPRFVRGGGMAIVFSKYEHNGDDRESAVLLEVGAKPRRMELGSCTDAIAVETTSGLAVLKKTVRSGAQFGNSPPGGLTLSWPWKSGAEIGPVLFDGRDVFDYDAVAGNDGIVIAAVTLTGLEVILVAPDKNQQSILVGGLPKDLELFSPALSVNDQVLSIATLAKPPYPSKVPSSLFYGVHQW